MTRVVLQYVLPLLLPTVVFIGWLAITRKRGETREQSLARLQEGPWFWLVVSGFGLVAMGFLYLGLNPGSPPESIYVPPHVEDGRVVPGQMR